MTHALNILPAIEDLKAITESGWSLAIDASSTREANGEETRLVGLRARRDLPGGKIEISVRATNTSETIESMARDLRHLCEGVKVRRISG